MVHLPYKDNVDVLTAYLTVRLDPAALDAIHKAFELGSGAAYDPQVELFISPDLSYLGQKPSAIRRAETAAGRTGSFLLIDENAVSKGALWYVDDFATDIDIHGDMELWAEGVELGQVDANEEGPGGIAESAEALWRILIKTESIPMCHVNYAIGNCSLTEDLENAGVEFPVPAEDDDFVQSEVYEITGLDWDESARHLGTTANLAPGEFEARDGEYGPEARVTQEVADSTGLSREWTTVLPAPMETLEDGTLRPYWPQDYVMLNLKYAHSRMRPKYQRLEGSL